MSRTTASSSKTLLWTFALATRSGASRSGFSTAAYARRFGGFCVDRTGSGDHRIFRMRPVTTRLRVILQVFAGLALIAGGLLFLGATRTDSWWAWTIQPPLTAATLGAFYWAAFVLILNAARSRTWAEARPAVYPVAVIALLLLVITLIHLDRFDLDSLFGVFWVCAYVLVPLLLAWALAEQLGT